MKLEFNVGDKWIDAFGRVVEIVSKSKNNIAVFDESRDYLSIYDNYGNGVGNSLVKKAPKKSILKVDGFIPVYKDMYGNLDTWLGQMFANYGNAQNYLEEQSCFGKVGGRMDAWKVIPHNFEIEVDLE